MHQLRQKKLEALKQQLEQQREEQAASEQQRTTVNSLLEPEARERLSNVRIANPALAEKIESLIIYAFQTQKMQGKLTDAQLRSILEKISGSRKPTKITRKEK